MPFYDREEELAFLREQFDRPGAGLVALYGRRRVGKTELLREFARAGFAPCVRSARSDENLHLFEPADLAG